MKKKKCGGRRVTEEQKGKVETRDWYGTSKVKK